MTSYGEKNKPDSKSQVISFSCNSNSNGRNGRSTICTIYAVQTVNAQSLSEFALLIQSQCGGQPEVEDDKIECGSLEAKNDKLELPGCEIKEDKVECP